MYMYPAMCSQGMVVFASEWITRSHKDTMIDDFNYPDCVVAPDVFEFNGLVNVSLFDSKLYFICVKKTSNNIEFRIKPIKVIVFSP